MNKNRGFTLIELLAVIVLLSVLAVGATSIIVKSMKNSKEKAKFIAAQDIVELASAYMEANSVEKVSIFTLIENGYLDPHLINPRTNDLNWGTDEQVNTYVLVPDTLSEKQDDYKVIKESEEKIYYKFDGYYYLFDKNQTIE